MEQQIGSWDMILGTMHEPAILLSRTLRVQAANRPFLETFHVSAEEILNERIFRICEGQWNFSDIRELLRVIRQGEGGRIHDIAVKRNFERIGNRTFRIFSCRLNEGAGNPILLAAHEIAPEPKYRRLFETARDGILVVDFESGTITDANQLIADLLGCEREHLIGLRFWEVEQLTGAPLGHECFERIRGDGLASFPVVTIQTEQGRCVETEVTGNVFDEGDIQSVQFNFRDITERRLRERQQQNEARQESMGVLAGGIAHDFNNLLAVIMGYASAALDDVPKESPYRQALDTVIRASQRGADLTDQMLAYSGKGTFVFRPVNFSDAVREAGALVQASLPESVTLRLELAPDILFVDADAHQLRRLITNLIVNGAEALPPGGGGWVRVATRRAFLDEEYIRVHLPGRETGPGAFVELEVADSGSGMDPATKARIFEPFFSTRFTGRGLGLAVVQGIVKRHSGAIVVETKVGSGTIFKVFLPYLESRD